MPVQSVNIPEGLKEQLDERMERKDYQNISEFIREAIREKLKREKHLYSGNTEEVKEDLEG